MFILLLPWEKFLGTYKNTLGKIHEVATVSHNNTPNINGSIFLALHLNFFYYFLFFLFSSSISLSSSLSLSLFHHKPTHQTFLPQSKLTTNPPTTPPLTTNTSQTTPIRSHPNRHKPTHHTHNPPPLQPTMWPTTTGRSIIHQIHSNPWPDQQPTTTATIGNPIQPYHCDQNLPQQPNQQTTNPTIATTKTNTTRPLILKTERKRERGWTHWHRHRPTTMNPHWPTTTNPNNDLNEPKGKSKEKKHFGSVEREKREVLERKREKEKKEEEEKTGEKEGKKREKMVFLTREERDKE